MVGGSAHDESSESIWAGWGPGHHSWNMEQNLHLIPDSLIKFFPYHLGVFYVYEEPQITALFPRIISKINKVINVYKSFGF